MRGHIWGVLLILGAVFCTHTLVLSAAQAFELTPEQETKIHALSHSEYWHRLLHYKRTFPLYRFRSLVDGPEFFFSSSGSTDPESEMTATIEAFTKNIEIGRYKQHPQCAFPVRYQYLKTQLNLKIQDVPCPKLEEALKKINARSTTIVFSSAYPNNPGSMFGHTFMRFNSKVPNADQQKLDMLDSTMNYAASIGDENGVLFALYGLFGGYQGMFSLVPYYVKVSEYNNSESRDLWEYDLSLTEEETQTLIKHFWEIDTTTYFKYFFLDENCSYLLLMFLEVAKPDWNLSDFPIYVTPGETIKKITSTPNAVTGVKFRPSLRKKMMQKFEALASESKSKFFDLINEKFPVTDLQDPLLLESASAYIYYKKQEKEGYFDDGKKKLLKKILMRRSELGQFTPKLSTIPADTQPDFAHNTYRLGTNSGLLRNKYFQDLHFRLFVHDLMNNDLGYIPFSQMEWPGITLRYVPADQKFLIEQILFMNLLSLFPLKFVEKRLSWGFNIAYETLNDLKNDDYSHVLHSEVNFGATTEVFSEHLIAYGLAGLNLDFGSVLQQSYRIGPKATLASLWNPSPRYKQQLRGVLIADLFQPDRQKLFHKWDWSHSYSFNRSWELRAQFLYLFQEMTLKHLNHESQLSLNFYF